MPSTQDYNPPLGGTIHQLGIKPIFDRLPVREKLYAHHLARAAWHGSRIIMRQVAPESPVIFDFITDLYRACDGQWKALIEQFSITQEELAAFLAYSATFLCNLGNHYVRHAEQTM
jgi:dipeptidyl-peptidase-3